MLDHEIAERFEDAQKYIGQFGQLTPVKYPQPVEYKPKFRRIGKDLFKPGYNNLLILHPLRLLGRIFDFKHEGVIVYRRSKKRQERIIGSDRKKQAKIVAMRDKPIWPKDKPTMTIQQACGQALNKFARQQMGAREALYRAIQNGDVRADNLGHFLGEYQRASDKSLVEFRETINGVTNAYRRLLKKEGLLPKLFFEKFK